uniref:DUF1618 domain-containing protein n=1 Tax=Leersia perrieri TaxID=77586 RepID=A0A0D9W0H8_9ORYZ
MVPNWVILSTTAIAGHPTTTGTASDITRNGKTIEVSISLHHPPQPSTLFVHSSDMNLAIPPTIISTEDNLLLLSVNMGTSGPYSRSPNDCDFFVYRAHPTSPSLHLLRRPHPYFNGFLAGILPRQDGHYTVAALIPTGTYNEYEIHLFHSDHDQSVSSGWSSSILNVDSPQRDFPVKIPVNSNRLHRHYTSKVMAIGGTTTMGWVDLWRGILFCDVLDNKLSLRGVPLPLALNELGYHHGRGFHFGPAAQRRSISFIRDDCCLRLVHLEINEVNLHRHDEETGAPSFRVDNWVLTTWTNARMSDSYEDWHQDHLLKGSDVIIDDPAVSHVLDSSGLLQRQPDQQQLALQNLYVSQPALSLNAEEEASGSHFQAKKLRKNNYRLSSSQIYLQVRDTG